jgi:hypothetical protein
VFFEVLIQKMFRTQWYNGNVIIGVISLYWSSISSYFLDCRSRGRGGIVYVQSASWRSLDHSAKNQDSTRSMWLFYEFVILFFRRILLHRWWHWRVGF